MLRIDPELLLAPIMELSSLISWLETKETNEEYDYTKGYANFNCKGCMCFQYFKENGIPVTHVDATRYYTASNYVGVRYPSVFNTIAYDGCFENKTFGDALSRARQLVKV